VIKTLENIEEKRLLDAGYKCIVGMDEAGMGPLAGPIVVGGVSLPVEFDLPHLYDSKKLTQKRRETLYGLIKEQALAWAVAEASADEINELGIRPATYLAYRRVLEKIGDTDFVLVDAWTIPEVTIPQKGIVGGDKLIASIAAASIMAKVHRDQLMLDFHVQYPIYGFDRHKGYGTKVHMDAIRTHGACPIHRTSWEIFDRL